MKKALWWIVPLLAVLGGGFAYWRYAASSKTAEIEYKTVAVEKKRIVGRITTSGTLQAVVTVQVGSQVSGRIQFLYADFNSQVKKGDLIAKIDPDLFQAAVAQSTANFNAARANTAQAKAKQLDADRQYKRTQELFAQGLVTQVEVDAAETTAAVAKAQVDTAQASVEVARAGLHQAQVNLSYCKILSPIDGVVISRNVDVGQTVAASLSAPVVFTIAEDLRKMQVNTSVSEGDVGRLEAGQSAVFTVDAFPGRRFKGTINQIRNAATTVQNVVTYNAVIDVSNDDLKLRPGMTANVTVTYSERNDVLSVSNQALRFRAPPELAGTATAAASGQGQGRGAGTGRGRGGRGAPTAVEPATSTEPAASGAPAATAASGGPTATLPAADSRTLWVLRDGKAQSLTIQTGLSDGTTTEVLGGDLKEGDLAITEAIVKGGSATPAATAAPAGGNQLRRMF